MLELAIVVPTLNERKNIGVLISRLDSVLSGIDWEIVFVDDDSPDGTADTVRAFARTNPRVRLLHRVGRRGLASACIEGMLSTSAPFIAVMDADLQHDESLLPEMLGGMRTRSYDLVVASRYVEGGGLGEFAPWRKKLSQAGGLVSQFLLQVPLQDPMSGFFLVDRNYFQSVVHGLSGVGFKILLDLVATGRKRVRVLELPYRFRERLHGESKLDLNVSLEYIILILDKLSHGLVPVRFLLFSVVGAIGVLLHQSVLAIAYVGAGVPFLRAQIVAAGLAMVSNFILNNRLTYRDRRLRGWRFFTGLLGFSFYCGLGALANFSLANASYQQGVPWFISGLFGTIIAAVWNFSFAASLTWRAGRGLSPRQASAANPEPDTMRAL